MTTLKTQYLVQHGGAANIDALITESMRRYLESHSEVMSEQFIREDINWVLQGRSE
ncbi:MAG: CopG family transcriptional regulator [Methylococcales bacterium]|nr:CopG family transcriptional regulator [Methylococcaceae bacterium]